MDRVRRKEKNEKNSLVSTPFFFWRRLTRRAAPFPSFSQHHTQTMASLLRSLPAASGRPAPALAAPAGRALVAPPPAAKGKKGNMMHIEVRFCFFFFFIWSRIVPWWRCLKGRVRRWGVLAAAGGERRLFARPNRPHA
jgi:hypothetical protein